MTTATPGYNVYDTNTLIQVVQNLKRAQSFLLDRFFPNLVTSDTEYVSIDVEIGIRRMSPFVSPLVEGKLVEQLRVQTDVFKPAYIKDKRAPDLLRPVRRSIGERIGGVLSAGERELANLNYEMEDQLDMLTRRLEWMAASALSTGTVTVAGEGFPTTIVDFGRDKSLTVAKTGGSQWTPANVLAGNASPTGDIEAWQRQVLKNSGAVVTDIIFTTSAYTGFLADPLLKGLIYYPNLSNEGNSVKIGPAISTGAINKGRWGSYNLWVYNDWYVGDAPKNPDGSAPKNSDGTFQTKEYPMIPDGTVILSGPDMQGTRAFGIIKDPKFNYASLPFAPKTWLLEDPAQRILMMQSAPLVIPSRANASLAATVCQPVYN